MENQLYLEALEIRYLYRKGKITITEAKERIKPFEKFFNNKSKEIAANYNQKPKLFNFYSFMR